MANDILVKIGADITDFSKKMAESNKALKNFRKANQDTVNAFKQTGDVLTKAITVPAVAAATALTGVTLVKGFGRLMGIDTARAKLSALGHDAESVEMIMDNALEAVQGTSYGLDEAATAAANAVAAGVEPGQDLAKYLGLASDAAAIAGTDFNEMGSIFNRVQTAQRAYAMESNMLADRGIPIYQWLAEEAGKSAEDIRDMAAQGEISSEMYFAAIEKNIGGAAQAIGEESFAAALKNIGSDIARIGANFLDAGGDGEGFFSTLKPLMTEFREYLSTIEDSAAEFGKKFGEAFINIIETIRELKERYDSLHPAMQSVMKYGAVLGSIFMIMLGPILKLIAFIPSIVSGFTMLKTAALAVGKALAAVNWPITLIVLAIVALAYLIYKYWDEIKEYTIIAWNAIKDFFSRLWESIKETAIIVWESIKTFFSDLWESIKNIASTAWQGFVDLVMAIIQPFIDGVMNIFNGMKDGLETMWNGITSFFGGIWDLIKNIFLGAVLLLINLVTGNFEELKKNAQAIWNNIKDALGRIWDGIKKVFSGALDAIWGAIKAAWGNIKSNTRAAFNWVRDTISSIWNGIKRFFTETLSNIWNNIRQKFTDIVNAAREKMNEAKQRIEDAWNNAKAFLEGINLKQIGRDIIQGLINGIKEKVTAVGRAVSDVTSAITGKVKSILGISSPSRVLAQFGKWTGEGLAKGITDSIRLVDRASERMADAVIPSRREIDLSYATPSGNKAIMSAINGTVEVRDRQPQGITQHITVVSPDATSPSENARKIKQAQRELAMEWRV